MPLQIFSFCAGGAKGYMKRIINNYMSLKQLDAELLLQSV